MRRTIAYLVAALVAVGMFTAQMRSAEAAPIRTALSIVIDGSGSIAPADFATQQTAYATVLQNLVPLDGTVVLNVVQFSSAAQVEQTAIRIESQANLDTVTNAILGMNQLFGGTRIDLGISAGVADMEGLLIGLLGELAVDFEKLVDVSTDGFSSGDPAGASAAAALLGYKINCLGIGAGANCDFNNGLGDDFTATTFAGVEAALDTKIREELRIDVPAPATILLLGIGLFGLGLARRRLAA